MIAMPAYNDRIATRLADRLARAGCLWRREIGGKCADLVLAQCAGDGNHDRIVAFAGLVFMQRFHDTIGA
jgi:hypothetical protein